MKFSFQKSVLHWLARLKKASIAKRASNVMTQTNKLEWRTIAFFKRVSLQYSKTTFLKRKLHSLYFSQNMLVVSETRRVPVICILFLDYVRFAIRVPHQTLKFVFVSLFPNDFLRLL